MESTRQHKVSRLIQKDLSDILLRYARSLSGTLISVSEVRVSPDLAIAHVYLSIFPQDRMESTLSKVNEDKGRLERHQLRIIPELHFHLDDTINRMERIDTLLQS